jgi:hypothetical protein
MAVNIQKFAIKVFLMIDNNLFLFNFLENNILKNKRKKY